MFEGAGRIITSSTSMLFMPPAYIEEPGIGKEYPALPGRDPEGRGTRPLGDAGGALTQPPFSKQYL